jgi:hypothetical protein
MKKYKVFDIDWDMGDRETCSVCRGSGITAIDSDGSKFKCEECNGTGEELPPELPNEMEVTLENDEDPAEYVADACTDKTGYLIIGCKWEEIGDNINPMFTKLSQHVGHAIDCVGYGTNGEYVNISIECLDCNEVLYDAEKYEEEV